MQNNKYDLYYKNVYFVGYNRFLICVDLNVSHFKKVKSLLRCKLVLRTNIKNSKL
jgi:hypothetical protein